MRKILVILVSLFSQIAQSIAEDEHEYQDLTDDPAYKAYIDKLIEQMDSQSTLSLEEKRKLGDQDALKEIHFETVEKVEDIVVTSKDNYHIPLRIYYPNQSQNLPILVFFHGGGWVFGSIAKADAMCRRFANHLNCIVASVGYRLAPENPFPKPLEDCYSAVEWIAKNYPNQIIVSGESAGGNLAAAVALLAHDRKGPHISAQLLINPVITSTIRNEPYEKCPDRHFITKDIMKYFWNMYLQSPEDYSSPYASPEKAKSLSKLPPAIIITAEYDPLRSEAEAYAESLRLANVPVFEKQFAKVIHGFMAISLYEDSQKISWTKVIREILREMGVL